MRNKFLQLILISLDSASWELHQYSRRMCGPMKIPKLTPAPGNRTRDLRIARPTLYLTTTDTTNMCCCESLYPFPKRQIRDSSKLTEFADGYSKFDENDRKSSKRVENTVGKEEIARYEQCLHCSQYFQKTCFADTYKQGLVWLVGCVRV